MKKTNVRSKASHRSQSKSKARSLTKAILYSCAIAIPAVIAFKNKAAVMAAALVAFDYLKEARGTLTEQGISLVEKAKEEFHSLT